MGAAVYQCLLPRTMPLYLGGGALDPKILGRETKLASVVERDFEYLFISLQAEFDRPAGGTVRAQPRPSRFRLRRRKALSRLFVISQRPRLVYEHNRDPVADRIGKPRLFANQLLRFAVVA